MVVNQASSHAQPVARTRGVPRLAGGMPLTEQETGLGVGVAARVYQKGHVLTAVQKYRPPAVEIGSPAMIGENRQLVTNDPVEFEK